MVGSAPKPRDKPSACVSTQSKGDILPANPPLRSSEASGNIVAAVTLMLASTLFLSVMQALVRHIGQDMHTLQVAFLRSISGLILVIPFVLAAGREIMATRRSGLHWLRAILIAVSTFAFFYGLSKVPLAEATALSFIGIIFGSLAAVVFLREPMLAARWIATIVAFGGVILILRPGYIVPSLGAYMVLFSSLTWGLALIVSKELSRTDAPLSIIAWTLIMMTLVSFVLAVPVWEWPTPEQWVIGTLIGATATAGHFSMTKSLQLADATIVLPLNFTRLIWAVVIGFVVFAELPDGWTIAGSILIVGSVMYLSRAEMRRKPTVK